MRHTSTTGSICVMYTTSALWIPWKAQDQHRSRVRVGGCSARLLLGTPRWHTPIAAQGWSSPEGAKSFGEPQHQQTGPAPSHTMLASSVLSDSELLLLSSLGTKGWGRRHGASHGARPASEQTSALEAPKSSSGTSPPRAVPRQVFFSNWGGFSFISNTSCHLFGSWDWQNKPALPSPHHPRVLEDSWTSHSVSQPVWA